MNSEIRQELFDTEPAPDWASRPWGRPTIHLTKSDMNENLVGTVEFKYHGIRLRGVRVFRNVHTGHMSVNMPQKRFGESIESVFFFVDPTEREQFYHDVLWLWQAIFGKRMPFTPKPGPMWFDETVAFKKEAQA